MRIKELWTLLGFICFAVVVWVLSAEHILLRIRENSMSPLLCDGDFIVAKRYSPAEPIHVNDILVFHSVSGFSVKRVVGAPNDKISFNGTTVFNGRLGRIDSGCVAIDQPFSRAKMRTAKVAQNAIFVVGDNREKSFDSRIYGQVQIVNVAAIVKFRIPATTQCSCTSW